MNRAAKLKQKCFATLTLCILFACGEQGAQSVLKIATDATFAPFHFVDKSGEATGFDIELAREISNLIGMQTEVVVLPYEQLFTGLHDSNHDVVAATTGITAEREARYLFSRPYFETCQVAVVRSGDNEPQTVDDLTDRRIGAAGSGTSFQAMQTLAGQHVHLNDGEALSSLREGSIDAWIVDEFDGVQAARESGGQFRVLAQPLALERYGMVMAPHRMELKAAIDQALITLEQNGRIAELRARFGVDRGNSWPVDW